MATANQDRLSDLIGPVTWGIYGIVYIGSFNLWKTWRDMATSFSVLTPPVAAFQSFSLRDRLQKGLETGPLHFQPSHRSRYSIGPAYAEKRPGVVGHGSLSGAAERWQSHGVSGYLQACHAAICWDLQVGPQPPIDEGSVQLREACHSRPFFTRCRARAQVNRSVIRGS